jgi:hypothetical protein
MKTPAEMLRVVGPAAVAALILSAVAPAAAGDVADLAREAEDLLQASEPATAYDAMDAAVDAFWRAAPLIIEDSRFGAAGDSATFAAGETVDIHVQPLGYGFDEGDGTFRIALDTGVEIRTPGGLILAQTEDFGRLEWEGPGKNRAFAGKISIDLPDLKPGDYRILLTVTDAASGKTASVTLPFSIAEQ